MVDQPVAEPGRCASCGAPHAPAQRYCLECGERISAPRKRVHWILPALGALLLAAGGAAVAIAATRQERPEPRTLVATQVLVTTAAPTETAPRASSPKPPSRPQGLTPSFSPGPARGSGLIAWPGGDRYTIVVGSFPLRTGLESAKARARQAVAAGLGNVGVLVSSSYSSLHPGLYVVFSGVYQSLEEAQSDLPSVRPRFPSAHAQQVVG